MAQVMLEKLINQEPCILLLSIFCDCKCWCMSTHVSCWADNCKWLTWG
jgi:hypothetical protein